MHTQHPLSGLFIFLSTMFLLVADRWVFGVDNGVLVQPGLDNLVGKEHKGRVGYDLDKMDSHAPVQSGSSFFLSNHTEGLPHARVFKDPTPGLFPQPCAGHLVRVRCHGRNALGKGRRPKIRPFGQVLLRLLAVTAFAFEQVPFDLFIHEKLQSSLGTTPVGSKDPLVKASNALLSPNGLNGVTVSGIGFLTHRRVGQELHTGPDHPNGVGEAIAADTGRQPAQEGIGGRTLGQIRTQTLFAKRIGVKVGRTGRNNPHQCGRQTTKETTHPIHPKNLLGHRHWIRIGRRGLQLRLDHFQRIGQTRRNCSSNSTRKQTWGSSTTEREQERERERKKERGQERVSQEYIYWRLLSFLYIVPT